MERPIFGNVARIAEFPFKSAGRVDRRSTCVHMDGIGLDRLFAFAHGKPDEHGVYSIATQRDPKGDERQYFARLARIQPNYVNDGIVLTYEGCDPIFVPLDYDRADRVIPVRSATFQGDTFMASRQDPALDEWATDHVGAPLIVLKAGQAFERYVDQDYGAYPNKLRFQDGFTGHSYPRSSVKRVEEVARRLSRDPTLVIDEESYRANIIFEAAEPGQLAEEPYSEHKIKRLQIGDVVYDQPKPCGRCPVTRVEQSTGRVRKFATETALNAEKRWVNKYGKLVVIFGENNVPLNEGELVEGMEVVIVAFRDRALVFGGKEIKPARKATEN